MCVPCLLMLVEVTYSLLIRSLRVDSKICKTIASCLHMKFEVPLENAVGSRSVREGLRESAPVLDAWKGLPYLKEPLPQCREFAVECCNFVNLANRLCDFRRKFMKYIRGRL